MFEELVSNLPEDIITKLKSTFQDPKYHSEGSVYSHMELVSTYLPMDINLQICNIFHDLGKIDTVKIVEKKNGNLRIHTIGHENYASQYIDNYKFLFEIYKPNWELIEFVCINHMGAHKYLAGEIKKASKLEIFENSKYSSELITFAIADNLGRLTVGAKPYLIITVGIPGSGKTTWRRKFMENTLNSNFVCVSPDDIREEITGDISNIHNDAKVWELAYSRIDKYLDSSIPVIFDATNINPRTRRELVSKFNTKSIMVYKIFECDPKVAIERIRKDLESNVNRSKVPDHIVNKMYEGFNTAVEEIMKTSRVIRTDSWTM